MSAQNADGRAEAKRKMIAAFVARQAANESKKCNTIGCLSKIELGVKCCVRCYLRTKGSI